MDIPEIFNQNLEKNIITEDMLGAALFSLNKRAKNYRDEKRKAKKSLYAEAKLFGFDLPEDPAKAEQMEKEMYLKKEFLLQIVKPICIHQELAGYKKEYIYDENNENYVDIFIDSIFHNLVLDRGVYRKDGKDVRLFVRRGEPYYRYYYFRSVKDHTYHIPVDKETALNSGLPIHIISEIKTEGEKEDNLIPMEFIDKLVSLVESGKFSYIQGNTDKSLKESFLPPVSYTMPQRYEWNEILNILKEKYKNENIPSGLSLTVRLWRRIMKKDTITAAHCIRCIISESKRAKKA